MRFYLSDMMVLLGYTVDTFENATAFLEKSLDISPAVVLLDMRMPGLNGLELQARLEALGRKTPIVFISVKVTRTKSLRRSDWVRLTSCSNPSTGKSFAKWWTKRWRWIGSATKSSSHRCLETFFHHFVSPRAGNFHPHCAGVDQ